MKMKEKGLANYIHTGGFNRLAGRPNAPGSWRPEPSFRKWKIFMTVLGMIFFLIGMFFVIF